MLNCNGMDCPYFESVDGMCNYGGFCSVKRYLLNSNLNSKNFLSVDKKIEAIEENVQDNVLTDLVQKSEVVFNPFQRGNGCVIEEICSYSR